jgi:signal peptidase I
MENSEDLKMAAATQSEVIKAASPVNFISQCNIWLSESLRLFRQFWIAGVLAVWGSLCYLLITHFLFLSVQVDGYSMVPSLEDSGHYWVNRMAYTRSEPHSCDIVALKDPRDETLVVKRIIAGPGQSIYLHQGKVYVDGKRLTEPYLNEKTYTFAYERKSGEKFVCVGKDEYFVMGDNRNNSTDSRTFGTVPRQNIVGKLVE